MGKTTLEWKKMMSLKWDNRTGLLCKAEAKYDKDYNLIAYCKPVYVDNSDSMEKEYLVTILVRNNFTIFRKVQYGCLSETAALDRVDVVYEIFKNVEYREREFNKYAPYI